MSKAHNHPTTEITTTGSPRQFDHGGRSVTFIPLQIKQRHTRKLLVPPAGGQAAVVKRSFDLPMIRTIGRAFYWQRLLDEGEFEDAADIAGRFKLEKAWVSEILRVTRLAPDILAAIADGRQPRHLNLQAIRRGIPVNWEEQRRMLGFVAENLGCCASDFEKSSPCVLFRPDY